MQINPYLNFKGNTEEAFEFYRSVFGGEFAMVLRFKDSPERDRTDPADGDKLMHIALRVGDSVIMGNDVVGPWASSFYAGNNVAMSLTVDSAAEADRIWAGLSAGGNGFLPMGKMFWGSYFGMLNDKFGIKWMISFEETTNTK